MADMFAPLVAQLKANPKTIVFTEGNDPRILEAASKLLAEGVLKVVMVGNEAECKAAAAAGIETYHGTAKRLMENRHYLGDDFYPAIIDQETYDKAAAIRLERAGKLGRLNRKKNVEPAASPTGFRMAAAERHYEDPRLQAEYLYSLIESEVS